MNTFKACVKKEVLEQLRTGKFIIFTAIGVGMVLMSFFTLGMMYLIETMGIDMGTIAESFKPTFANGTMMFMAFMQSYFYIPVLIMIMGVVSKEIAQKKWTLPISSGISPSSMIAAKFVVVVSSILLASIISIALHFGLTMLLSLSFMTPQVSWQSDISGMFRAYGYFLFFTMFLTIASISINAITKKGWTVLSITIPTIILLPVVLSAIMVGGTELVSYTPFYFLNEISKAAYMLSGSIPNPTLWQVLSSYSSTIIASALLVFFAIRSTKINKISA